MSWQEKTDAEKMRAVLAVLPVSVSNYNEWVQIGMACKNTGLACSEWDAWSKTDADAERYHKGECSRKWRGFKDKGVGVGTAMEICGRHSCEKQVITYYDGESGGKLEVYDWDDELPATEPRQTETREAEAEAEAAIMEPGDDWEPGRQLAEYLAAVFRDGEKFSAVFSATEDKPGKWRPNGSGFVSDVSRIKAKLEEGAEIENILGPYKRDAGAWIRINPVKDTTAGASDQDVEAFRHVLVEADEGTPESQLSSIRRLNLPCSAIVHSGGKSIHAIVKIEADSLDDYKKRVRQLYDACKKGGLLIDEKAGNPARLSRVPGVIRGGHKQFLIATNCGAASWEEWKENAGGSIPIVDAGDWLEHPEPEPEPILKNWLDRGDFGIIVGGSKLKKSFFTLQLAISMAAGRGFLGFGIDKPLKVLYLQYEIKSESFQKRLEAMARAMMIDKGELRGRLLIANMRGLADDCKREEAIRRAIMASKPAVVVIDPVYKMIDGDESDQKTAKEFVKMIDRLMHDTGAAVLGVFHTSKSGRDTATRRAIDAAAGSGVFGRTADSQFLLSPHDLGKNYAILTTECRNYMTPEDMTLHFENGMFTAEAATPAVPPSLDNRKKQQAKQAEITPEVVAGWFAKVGVPMNNQTLRAYLTDAGCGSRVDALEKKISELKQAGVILEDEKRGPRGAKQYRPGPEAEETMRATLTGADDSDIPPF